MDTAFRRLFARKKSKRRISSPHRQRQIEGQSYDSVVAAKPPTIGTYPVGGNGPTPVIRQRPRPRLRPQSQRQNSRRTSIELVAEPPSVPRRRRHSDNGRPRTAPQGSFPRLRHDADEWIPSRYSAILAAPPTLRRKSSRRTSTAERSAAKRVRSMVALTSETQAAEAEERLPYVDLLEAFWHLKPSRETYVGRAQASGRRDYGEDVADRNIADYGSLAAKPSRNMSPYNRRNVARLHRDDMNLDAASSSTTPLRHGQIGEISTYAPTNEDAQPRMTRTFANTAEPRFNTRGLRLRARPHSAFADSRPFGGPSSRPTSVTSVGTDAQIPARNDNLPLRSSQWASLARNGSISVSRQRSSVGASLAPISIAEGDFSRARIGASDEASPTFPLAAHRLSGQGSLLTPPMSPVTSSPAQRSSLDKGPPPLQRTGSQGQSTRYSTDQAQESPPNTADGAPAAILEHERGSLTAQPSLKRRAGCVLEDSSEPDIESIVDLADSTDAEIITHQEPAVIHEHITPVVHNVREEQINREIHNHDVLHRIQPIVDVEILPTKHYIPSPSGDGLIEVPTSIVPGRHDNLEIKAIVMDGAGEGEEELHAEISKPDINSTTITNEQPTVADEDGDEAMAPDDIPRGKSTWRHPSELEGGGQSTDRAAPIHIYYGYDDDYDDYSDEFSDGRGSVDGQEEELLFNDSVAFGGRLPGLDDWNPASADPPLQESQRTEVVEGEVGSTLKKRQAEFARKMAAMSLEE